MSIGNSNIHQISEIPEITKLPNGRLRVVRRFKKFTREDVDNASYGSLLGDFGDLDTAGQQIVNQGYTDLQLISVEIDSRFNAVANNSNAVLVKTYETLTSSFVQVTDEDQIEELENGIKRLTRVLRAQSGTTYSGDVGTTNAGGSNTSFILAKSDLKDSGSFAELTLSFLTSGITDVREDIVGSQKAIIITKVGSEPTTSEASAKSDITYDGSSDWSIARKDTAQEGGLNVYTYTFLLDNTILSQSQDRQNSLKTEVIEVFNPKVTIDGLSIDGGSSISGDYFLYTTQSNNKNRYYQSQGDMFSKGVTYSGSSWQINQFTNIFSTSTDTNSDNVDDPPLTGWNGTGDNELFNITFREFDQTLPSSLQGLAVSHRYDKRGYSLIGIQQSNLDGVPTMRYTFAKDNSIVSVTEDKIGSQNAIVNEIFNPTSESITGVDTDNVALSGYSEVDRTESNYEGIKTIRVRFLKDDTVLSKSTDSKSPLLTEVLEVFKPSSSRDTQSNFTLVSKVESNVDGIPTERYTFNRNGVILSESFDLVGSQKSVVISKFQAEPTTAEASLFSGESGYSIARKEESGALGKETFTYTFLQSNALLSVSEEKVGSQNAIVNEIFNPTDEASIPCKDVDGNTITTHTEADRTESNHDGITTVRVRFLRDDVVLSRSRDSVGSQKAVVLEVFNGNNEASDANTYGAGTDYVLAREEESNVDGIDTKRYTYLQPSILSVAQDFVEDINTIQVQAFSKISTEVVSDLDELTNDHRLIEQKESNHDGIKTTVFTFEINTSDVVRYTANNRLQVSRTIYEAFNYDYNAIYDIGNTSITFSDAGNITLVLSELRVDKRGDSGTFVKLQAIFTEPGESARSESTGPQSMPGTERITITSSGSTPVALTETNDIKLVDKQQQNNNGFSAFSRSYIKGTDATSTTIDYVSGRTYKVNSNGDYSSVGGPNPGIIGGYFQATSGSSLGSGVTAYLVGQITGDKVSYENILSVQVPGTVKCRRYTATGNLASSAINNNKYQAFIETVPPNTIKIKATVTESISTVIPTISQLAYNLDGISCAITRINTSLSNRRGPTASTVSSANNILTDTGFQKNASLSTNNSYFPGSYLLDGELGYTTTGMIGGKLYRIIDKGANLTDAQWETLGASASAVVGEVFTYSGTPVANVVQDDTIVREFGMDVRYDYQSSSTPYSNNNVISFKTGFSYNNTAINVKGSTALNTSGDPPSSYTTTGTIQQKARPVLTTLDGTTYYEVIKFSKDS
jgi:hypothetical protein